MVATESTIFPRIIAEVEWGGGGDGIFNFLHQRGRLFKGKQLFDRGDFFKI